MERVPKTITIALATYQGANYLEAQLQSIADQTYPHWRLLVSDDNSSDGTLDIVKAFAAAQPAGRVELIDGPQKGATANFLHLTRRVDGDWLAYCDQDDVWKPEKLAIAVNFLEGQTGPALYAARTTICDDDLNVIGPAPAYTRPLALRNALIQACTPGNTIVVNEAALDILKQGVDPALAADVVAHDWWAYQLLAAAGAAMWRDTAQVVFYRQHPRNVMGRNDTTKARAARLSMLMDGSFADWLQRNQRALEPMVQVMTPKNRQLLADFGTAISQNGPRAAARFLRMGLYRQTRSGTLAVMGAALAGRLKPPVA